MSTPQSQPHTWAITGQQEEPTIDEEGRPTSVHHVEFKTNTGHTSRVTIPDAQFNAVTVARAVKAKAKQIVDVHHMTSENAPEETR